MHQCGRPREAGQSVYTYFSLPLAPPTGNKKKIRLARKTTARRSFGGVVNFCLSLLSAYWVLSAYFLAVFEISVCSY